MSRKQRTARPEGVRAENNSHGKTVADYKGDYERHSAKLSDINRNVAFAGIGLIWIFTEETATNTIPTELVLPAIFLVSALALDILHYLYCTLCWYGHFRVNEKKNEQEETKYNHHVGWTYPPWVLWILKVGGVIAAYICIFIYLFDSLVK